MVDTKNMIEADTKDMIENMRLRADLKEAHIWIAKATKMITSLTGGGSENFVLVGSGDNEMYVMDLPVCEQRIRERFEKCHRLLVQAVKDKKEVEQRLEESQKRLEKLEQVFRSIGDFMESYQGFMGAYLALRKEMP